MTELILAISGLVFQIVKDLTQDTDVEITYEEVASYVSGKFSSYNALKERVDEILSSP